MLIHSQFFNNLFPKQREGCVPMVRTTFRRPPQSHVTSLGRRGYPGRCRTPTGSRNGAEHAKQRPALDHQKGTAPDSKAEAPGGNSCGPRRGRTGAQNAQTGATPGPRKRHTAQRGARAEPQPDSSSLGRAFVLTFEHLLCCAYRSLYPTPRPRVGVRTFKHLPPRRC